MLESGALDAFLACGLSGCLDCRLKTRQHLRSTPKLEAHPGPAQMPAVVEAAEWSASITPKTRTSKAPCPIGLARISRKALKNANRGMARKFRPARRKRHWAFLRCRRRIPRKSPSATRNVPALRNAAIRARSRSARRHAADFISSTISPKASPRRSQSRRLSENYQFRLRILVLPRSELNAANMTAPWSGVSHAGRNHCNKFDYGRFAMVMSTLDAWAMEKMGASSCGYSRFCPRTP